MEFQIDEVPQIKCRAQKPAQDPPTHPRVKPDPAVNGKWRLRVESVAFRHLQGFVFMLMFYHFEKVMSRNRVKTNKKHMILFAAPGRS